MSDNRSGYIVFGQPKFTDEEIEIISGVFRSGWIGTGPKVKEFETEFAKYVGAKYAAAAASCTAALELALSAFGIGQGDEVITTAMTFAATVNAIIHVGARPVLVDIEKDSFNLDPELVERAITKKTKAVVPVHFAGAPVNLDAMLTLRQKHGFKLVQDCAHAIETQWNGKRVGSYPDAACYSFYPTKNITTIEGGMVCSDDEEYIGRVRMMGNHGMSKDAWKRFSSGGYAHYDVLGPGYKANMTDVQASLGLSQLRHIDQKYEARSAVWRRYQKELAAHAFERPREVAKEHLHAYHLYTLLVDEENSGHERDEWLTHMHQTGIGCGVHYRAIPRLTYYRKALAIKPEDFPRADRVGQRTISIPLSPYLSEEQVAATIGAVKAYSKK